MRIYTLFFCLFVIIAPIFSQTMVRDSLRKVLATATHEGEKQETLTNLMDISRNEEQLNYAKQLYKESQRLDNKSYREIALTKILEYYVMNDAKDSTDYYLSVAGQEFNEESRKYMIPYFKMIQDVRITLYEEGDEARKKLVEECLVKLETHKNGSVTDEIAANYILGMEGRIRIQPEDREKILSDIIPYFKNVLHLSDKIPDEYAIQYQLRAYFMLCTYTQGHEAANYAQLYLKACHKFDQLRVREKRPFTNKKDLMNAYTTLSVCSDFIGRDKAVQYYNKFVELNKNYPDDANVTSEYEYVYTSLNHYSTIKEYKKALEFCDSMIVLFRKLHYDDHIVFVIKEKVNLYDSLKMYKKAYENYKIYAALVDSSHAKSRQNKLDDLEIQKDVNRLVVEKTSLELEVENNRARVYYFSALLLLAICTIVYIIFRLGKIKMLYGKLQESNRQVIRASEKAQESEKMKSAFIRNMYHEVRTLLNAINGFSALIADDEVPADEKREFSRIIFDNCNQITRMMDDVIQIAQLDSSNDKLSVVPVHIYPICLDEMELLKRDSNNDSIVYRVEGDCNNDLINTNQAGFIRVIAHLLGNAGKFTGRGSIVLSFRLESEQNQVILSLTDTGCGIPAGKAEWVFERFTKTNEFVPGSGLGLYLCRSIIERLGGQIVIDIQYTGGTRFLITLPI